MKDNESQIFWKNNPDLESDDFDENNGYGTSDETSYTHANKKITDCATCIAEGSNKILCCPSHPETKEISSFGYCPNLNVSSGKCKEYLTENYPSACMNYHCKTHN